MKVMFVQILGYNLISLVREIAIIGFATFFHIDIVILMWSKTLSIDFVGYVQNDLYVINFWKKCVLLEEIHTFGRNTYITVNMRSLEHILTCDYILGLT
jgi:hypothetical protein